MLDATKACKLTGWKNPNYLATLAAAFAEAGNFDDAVKWEEKAIELSRKNPRPNSVLHSSFTEAGNRIGRASRVAHWLQPGAQSRKIG